MLRITIHVVVCAENVQKLILKTLFIGYAFQGYGIKRPDTIC